MEHTPHIGKAESDAFERYTADFPLTQEELHAPLLDVGAAEGHFIRYLRDALGNKDAVGIELQGRKVRSGDEGMAVADGKRLPFADGTFYTTIARNYVPMFYDEIVSAVPAIEEFLRVTRSGGRVLFDAPTPEQEAASGIELLKESPDSGGAWLAKRQAGAITFFRHLDILRVQGFIVEVSPLPKNVSLITIQKP